MIINKKYLQLSISSENQFEFTNVHFGISLFPYFSLDISLLFIDFSFTCYYVDYILDTYKNLKNKL